jgi:hypothetical protein
MGNCWPGDEDTGGGNTSHNEELRREKRKELFLNLNLPTSRFVW